MTLFKQKIKIVFERLEERKKEKEEESDSCHNGIPRVLRKLEPGLKRRSNSVSLLSYS